MTKDVHTHDESSFILCVVFDYERELVLLKKLATITDDRGMFGIGQVKSDAGARGFASTPDMRVV